MLVFKHVGKARKMRGKVAMLGEHPFPIRFPHWNCAGTTMKNVMHQPPSWCTWLRGEAGRCDETRRAVKGARNGETTARLREQTLRKALPEEGGRIGQSARQPWVCQKNADN